MDVFNPKILDASIRDVTSHLTDDQKADVLLYALQYLPYTKAKYRTLLENAVDSCLQIPSLSSPNVAKAYLSRARARLASGLSVGAHQDIQKALVVQPENADAKLLMHRSIINHDSSCDEPASPYLTASQRFSVEIWREIALFLPRRDLLSLLWIPHPLSRIASQLLFRKIDLHFSSWIPLDEDEEENMWHPNGHVTDSATDGPHAQRSADILTRVITDSSFASLVKTLRIHAVTRDSSSIAFQTGMLANAFPKLTNLQNLHCSAKYEDAVSILRLVQSSIPKLKGLSLSIYGSPDTPEHLDLPDFQCLTHLSYIGTGTNAARIQNLLNQNRDTLQKLSLDNKLWSIPADISVRNLTHLDVQGQITDSQAFASILSTGHQLEYLRIDCVLKCHASPQFSAYQANLPFLRHFSFAVHSIHRLINDPELFPSISEFVRGRAQLRSLRLTVCDSEIVQRAIGFDASVWGVLPSLPNLKTLSITYPRGLVPGLASWLVPRGVRSLGLDSLKIPAREPVQFLNQLRMGMPSSLRYVTLKNLSSSTVAEIIEQGFPTVRLFRAGDNYWTVMHRADGSLDLEQWPRRQSEYHAAEWLEWLDCEEHGENFTDF